MGVYFCLCLLRRSLSSLCQWLKGSWEKMLPKLVLSHCAEQNSCCCHIGLEKKPTHSGHRRPEAHSYAHWKCTCFKTPLCSLTQTLVRHAEGHRALRWFTVHSHESGLNQELYCPQLPGKLAEHQFYVIEAGLASGSDSIYSFPDNGLPRHYREWTADPLRALKKWEAHGWMQGRWFDWEPKGSTQQRKSTDSNNLGGAAVVEQHGPSAEEKQGEFKKQPQLEERPRGGSADPESGNLSCLPELDLQDSHHIMETKGNKVNRTQRNKICVLQQHINHNRRSLEIIDF